MVEKLSIPFYSAISKDGGGDRYESILDMPLGHMIRLDPHSDGLLGLVFWCVLSTVLCIFLLRPFSVHLSTIPLFIAHRNLF